VTAKGEWGRRLMAVAWPAFLAACALELLVFAFADPLDLRWAGAPLGWSRQAVYSVAFFAFWGVAVVSSVLTMALDAPASDDVTGRRNRNS
jgi:hypothetical protein